MAVGSPGEAQVGEYAPSGAGDPFAARPRPLVHLPARVLRLAHELRVSMLELTLTQMGAIRPTDIRVSDVVVDGNPILAED